MSSPSERDRQMLAALDAAFEQLMAAVHRAEGVLQELLEAGEYEQAREFEALVARLVYEGIATADAEAAVAKARRA